MWGLFSRKKGTAIAAPVSGKVIKLEDMKDEAFSNGGMGTGFAIEFNGKTVVSPIAGTVEMCFPTGHAFGVKAGELEVLIHVGIDTVELNGNGFHVRVKPGMSVRKGDILAEVDSEFLRSQGYDPTTAVLFPDFNEIKTLDLNAVVEAGKDVAHV